MRTLYIPARAKINDSGVEFQKLHYRNADNAELFSLMMKSKANRRKAIYIDILYDPNSIAQIHYYDKNHEFVDIDLNVNYKNQEELKKYSFALLKAHRKGISRNLKAAKEEKRNLKSERDAHIAGVVTDAIAATPTKPISKNMREHRAEEECFDSYRGSPSQLLEEQKALEAAENAKALPAPDPFVNENHREEDMKEEKHGYSQEEHYESMFDCL